MSRIHRGPPRATGGTSPYATTATGFTVPVRIFRHARDPFAQVPPPIGREPVFRVFVYNRRRAGPGCWFRRKRNRFRRSRRRRGRGRGGHRSRRDPAEQAGLSVRHRARRRRRRFQLRSRIQTTTTIRACRHRRHIRAV